MDITSRDTLNRHHEMQRERIHIELLTEAIKGLTDLKAKKTLSLAQLKSRFARWRGRARGSAPESWSADNPR